MRVLVCIAHYVPKSGPRHSIEGSSQETTEQRAATVTYCIQQWSSLLASHRFLLGTDFAVNPAMAGSIVPELNAVSGTIYVCVNADNHLFEHMQSTKVHTAQQPVGDPRHLPYVCRHMFLRLIEDYDLFVYTEDDTVPLDPAFFAKYACFDREFGSEFILLPNRYELFSSRSHKVYLEFPSPEGYRVSSPEPGPDVLTMRDGTELVRTDSPYAGCFAITRQQLRDWVGMPHFFTPTSDFDANVLEQAMIPMFGRRPIYRPARKNLSYLEVHHVSGRNSHARTPARLIIGQLEGPLKE